VILCRTWRSWTCEYIASRDVGLELIRDAGLVIVGPWNRCCAI
jgi:hypothetical protein